MCANSHVNDAGRLSTAPTPVFHWLNSAAAATDWGLPEAGPAAALLRLDTSDWEPPGYCPVRDVLKPAKAGGPAPWHNNIRSPQDPLTGLFSMQVRCRTQSGWPAIAGVFMMHALTVLGSCSAACVGRAKLQGTDGLHWACSMLCCRRSLPCGLRQGLTQELS